MIKLNQDLKQSMMKASGSFNMEKLFIGLSEDQWNLIHRLLIWEMERQDEEEKEYLEDLKNIEEAILKEVL
jgi:hypothetical protein